MNRKHKTRPSAKAELAKLQKKDPFHAQFVKIWRIKGATVWKYWLGTELEWLNK